MNTLAKHNESFKNALAELGFTSRFDGCHHTKGSISITKVLNRFIIGDNEGKTSEHKTFINKEQLEQNIKDFESSK